MASRPPADPDGPIEDGDDTTGKPYPAEPAPDPAEEVRGQGEPAPGNFA